MLLKEVCIENVWDIIKLEVHDSQKSFVATNTQSILEAYCTIQEGGTALPFGIYDDDVLIGFVMLGYGYEEGDPAFVKDRYCLWRFMIDKKFQGKGYGKKALLTVLDYIYDKNHVEKELVYGYPMKQTILLQNSCMHRLVLWKTVKL